MKSFLGVISGLLFLMLLTSCGNHSDEDSKKTGPFNDGAAVVLSGTAQKEKIKKNQPIQIIASTTKAVNEPSYIAVSSKAEIANVSAAGQVITIIGVKLGTTKIIVIDDANGRPFAEFDIEVLTDGTDGDGGGEGGGGGNGGGSDDDDDPDKNPVTEKDIGPVGDPITINFSDQSMTLQSIPFGKYVRGDSTIFSGTDSLPRHIVNLPTTFWMGEYEVTNSQFVAFLNDVESSLSLQSGIISGDYNRDGVNETWAKIKPVSLGHIELDLTVKEENKNKPVLDVSWYGAMAFARWLSATQSGTYRLPTEAEWEYAVRGNQRNDLGQIVYARYPWGTDLFESAYANTSGLSGLDQFTTVSPVGSFPLGKNLLQLHDTIGNLAEWTYDTYQTYSSGEVTNPFNDLDGDKVYRGGSWGDSGNSTSVSDRNSLNPTVPSSTIGFRLIRFDQGTDPLHIHETVSVN